MFNAETKHKMFRFMREQSAPNGTKQYIWFEGSHGRISHGHYDYEIH